MISEIARLEVPNALQLTYALHNLILDARFDGTVGQVAHLLQVELPLLDFFDDRLEQVLKLLVLLALVGGFRLRMPGQFLHECWVGTVFLLVVSKCTLCHTAAKPYSSAVIV